MLQKKRICVGLENYVGCMPCNDVEEATDELIT